MPDANAARQLTPIAIHKRAPGRVAPLGLQPGDEQRKPFEGIDDPQGDIPDGFGAVGGDVRGRRKRILGRGILRDPGVFLSGEQGSQAGEQLVASGRVFKRLDQAAQMRFFGDGSDGVSAVFPPATKALRICCP